MFWDSFSGRGKGPGFFWEKEWGTINAASYRECTLPVIDEYFRSSRESGFPLFLMQNNAPSYATAETINELRDRSIDVIKWLPFSLDLNPIEFA